MSQFNAPHFQTHEAARAYLEKLRWGDERVCPHCGVQEAATQSSLKALLRFLFIVFAFAARLFRHVRANGL
nr:transposase [Bradyrhizobium forestalis]